MTTIQGLVAYEDITSQRADHKISRDSLDYQRPLDCSDLKTKDIVPGNSVCMKQRVSLLAVPRISHIFPLISLEVNLWRELSDGGYMGNYIFLFKKI